MTTQVANFTDGVTTSDSLHAATELDQAAHFTDGVTTSDSVTTVRTTFATFVDHPTTSDSLAAALGPPQNTSDEIFSIGTVAVDSVEPFDIEQADVGVDSVEPFDIEGNAGASSVEPFDIGTNIGVDSVEPFAIFGPSSGGYDADGNPMSPQLGHWVRPR